MSLEFGPDVSYTGEMQSNPIATDSWFNLSRDHGVAYAVQESWVQNDTIKVRYPS